jgi:WD40-like Beta Propeller Repeat
MFRFARSVAHRSVDLGPCALFLAAILVHGDPLAAEPIAPTDQVDLSPYADVARVTVDDVVYFINDPRAQARDLPHNLYRANTDGSGVTALLSTEEAEACLGGYLIADPRGGLLAWVHSRYEPETRGTLARLIIFDTQTGALRTLVDEDREIFTPVFSPDGSMIAFFSAPKTVAFDQHEGFPEGGCRLDIVDVESGEVRIMGEPSWEAHPSSPPSWSPDGEWITCVASIWQRQGMFVHVDRVADSESHPLDLGDDVFPRASLWIDSNTLLVSGIFQTTLEESPAVEGIARVHPGEATFEIIFEGFVSPSRLSISPDRRMLEVHWANPDNGNRQERRFLTVDGEPVSEEAISDLRSLDSWRLTSSERE